MVPGGEWPRLPESWSYLDITAGRCGELAPRRRRGAPWSPAHEARIAWAFCLKNATIAVTTCSLTLKTEPEPNRIVAAETLRRSAQPEAVPVTVQMVLPKIF